MRTNVKKKATEFTHEGAEAASIKPEQALRRSVMSCFLFEKEHYEDGVEVSKRIAELCTQVPVDKIGEIAIDAREKGKLRHVPLFLIVQMLKRGSRNPNVKFVIARVIQRADEIAELLALYWKDGKRPLSGQLKKGLALAFGKFGKYQLAKYANPQNVDVRLRDVMMLVRPKPGDAELYKSIAEKTIAPADTWELGLMTGQGKKETFERLLREGKLGYLALLRNLRNMVQAGVDLDLVKAAIVARKGGADRVLPFRFVSAAVHAPSLEPWIDQAFCAAIDAQAKMSGKTVIVVDVSGSMYHTRVSAKSEMDRAKAAASLAAIARGAFHDVRIFATAGDDGRRKHATIEVPPRSGNALVDAIYGQCRPLGGGGIFVHQVMDYLRKTVGEADRLIVITDEQDCGIAAGDSPLSAIPIAKRAYMINVASAKNGVGYGPRWVHIDGFSESALRFIQEYERADEPIVLGANGPVDEEDDEGAEAQV